MSAAAVVEGFEGGRQGATLLKYRRRPVGAAAPDGRSGVRGACGSTW